VDEFGCIALILIGVVKESVTHTNQGGLILESVSELLVPHPVVRVLRLDDLVIHKVINNLDIMNDV